MKMKVKWAERVNAMSELREWRRDEGTERALRCHSVHFSHLAYASLRSVASRLNGVKGTSEGTGYSEALTAMIPIVTMTLKPWRYDRWFMKVMSLLDDFFLTFHSSLRQRSGSGLSDERRECHSLCADARHPRRVYRGCGGTRNELNEWHEPSPFMGEVAEEWVPRTRSQCSFTSLTSPTLCTILSYRSLLSLRTEW